MKNAAASSLKFRLLVFVFCLLPRVIVAQPSLLSNAMEGYTFSYSIVETEGGGDGLLKLAQQKLVTVAAQNNGLLYASWLPAAKPADAPFAGLSENQLGLMFAWSDDAEEVIAILSDTLKTIDSVSMRSNRLFEAVYLPAGPTVPTGPGFYVHREEKYSLANVEQAVRLSKEAWISWEPHWGVTVVGLFRELGLGNGFDNLNRIVWYPSYEGWMETRNFTEEQKSANLFRQRRGLLIPGSGIAIATDREVPL